MATRPTRKRLRRCDSLYVFLVVLSCSAYFLPRWANWNDNARLDLVLAIVDGHTLRIDRYVANTGDYAHFGEHYYLDKAPGLSWLAVPIYAAVRPILRSAPVQQRLGALARSDTFAATLTPGGKDVEADRVYFAMVLYIATFFTVSLPAALVALLVYHAAEMVVREPTRRVAAALLYALATPAFAYAGVFFAHQMVAFCLFAAFCSARRIAEGGSPHLRWVVGGLLGYALISEYPTVLIAGALFVYALATWPTRRWVLHALLATAPSLALLAIYNLAIFGTPLPVGYWYSERYTDLHSQGFVSISGPQLDALWGITFSRYRGLFFLAPVTLLAVPGFVAWWRRGQHRQELLVCVWAVLSFLLFNGSSVMWHGGHAVGPRYLVPMLPFLAVGMASGLDVLGNRWLRAVCFSLAAWSFLAVWAETIGGQSFPDWTANPLFAYSLPRLMAGNVARNLGMLFDLRGFASLLPLAAWVVLLTLGWRRLRQQHG